VAAAIDAALRPALLRPPCLLSFSGGRDSSALLAHAVDLARREGLEPPIPATLVIPGDSDADETEWQDTVLRHLGIIDRIRFRVGTELDCVGPVARDMLREHGLVWPFNTHMHVPIFAAAAGGTVVTGFGGDELGRSSEHARAAQVLARRRGPTRADLLIVGLAAAPPPVRRAVYRRRNRQRLDTLPWLTATARRALADDLARHDASVPIGWRSTVTDWWSTRRYFRLVEQSFATVAEPWDVRVVHPFADGGVRAALARQGGFGGLGSRSELLDVMFGTLLPAAILHRRSKAAFSNVLFTDVGRAVAAELSGGGIDPDLVDVPALRHHWAEARPVDMKTMAALQTGWLFDEGARIASGRSTQLRE
jgi:asparagine synthase (glutamine-hydrolysing)